MKNIVTLVKRTLGAAVLAAALIAPAAAHARIFLSVGIAPPVIPVYEQPLCPGDGYIWTPGYWAYGDDGYFWVDGAWVEAPYENALWTPGYWGYNDNAYVWNAGYWGPTVGYYGGINYGFGYFGAGFYGGYWNGGHFFYNRGYNHLDFNRIRNVYNTPYRGGFDHPGGRAFDNNPQHGREFAENRGSAVNGRDFNRGNDNHGNFDNRANFDNRGGQPNQQNGANLQNRTAQPNQSQQPRAFTGGGDNYQRGASASQNGYRPTNMQTYSQQNNAQPDNARQGFSQSQQPQQQNRQAYTQPSQNYSRPANNPTPQAQPQLQTRPAAAPASQSRPAAPSVQNSNGFHGGGGAEGHSNADRR